jgi:serine/threonine protein kinase
MILEYMPGGTLANMITHFTDRDRPLKDKHIANFTSQIGSALECLHGMNIIHRDVSFSLTKKN